MKSALIILNGAAPEEDLLRKFWNNTTLKICADGGANSLVHFNLEPDFILGDMDSIRKEVSEKFSQIQKIVIENQDTTDAEKAILFCLEKEVKEIHILGATGKRQDHTLYNFGILRKFQSHCRITLHTVDEEIFIIDRNTTLTRKPGTRISILPLFGVVEGVTVKGLVYPIVNQSLEMGVFSSISNIFLTKSASIQLKKGELLIFIEKKQ